MLCLEKNGEIMMFLIDYIEEHLQEEITLEELAQVAGYSKYHLHRMFTGLIGFSLHAYIKRRRLTEAAKELLFTEKSILDIALDAAYESQQAFTLAFKEVYKMTPQHFRKKHDFQPIQLKFKREGDLGGLRGERIQGVQIVEKEAISLVGYKSPINGGFLAIPRLWKKLHKNKQTIKNRVDLNYTVSLDDYRGSIGCEEKKPAFDYYAAVEVSAPEQLAPDMETITLPKGKYIVFTYKGRAKDSLQPVMEYIYKEWFPEASCQFNEQAPFDFTRYSEEVDEKGHSLIEVWIPIIG